uniref:Uncharacterized protein n=1 Tax=Anopheles coluzzii TaxID=1518534 RepID=A0A8W7PXK6_ANOCL
MRSSIAPSTATISARVLNCSAWFFSHRCLEISISRCRSASFEMVMRLRAMNTCRSQVSWYVRTGFGWCGSAGLAQNVHDKVQHTFGPQVPDALVRDDGFALPVPGLQDLLHQYGASSRIDFFSSSTVEQSRPTYGEMMLPAKSNSE